MKKITVIDYGLGNLHSVCAALAHEGLSHTVTSDRNEIARAEALILPGVGAFPDAMKMLSETGLVEVIREQSAKGVPLLGICLGMQLLADASDEGVPTAGLGLIPGVCRKLSVPGLKVPHVGWNSLVKDRADCPLLEGLGEEPYMYFVHSYHFCPKNPSHLVAHTVYGGSVSAIVTNGRNVFGAQFHPEKSGDAGLALLRNFGA